MRASITRRCAFLLPERAVSRASSRQRSAKVVKAAVSLYGNATHKAEKEDSVDNYPDNNPLHVDPPYSSLFRWLRETAFGYERMITHDGMNPAGAFGSSDGIIYVAGGDRESILRRPRDGISILLTRKMRP